MSHQLCSVEQTNSEERLSVTNHQPCAAWVVRNPRSADVEEEKAEVRANGCGRTPRERTEHWQGPRVSFYLGCLSNRVPSVSLTRRFRWHGWPFLSSTFQPRLEHVSEEEAEEKKGGKVAELGVAGKGRHCSPMTELLFVVERKSSAITLGIIRLIGGAISIETESSGCRRPMFLCLTRFTNTVGRNGI